MFTNTLLLQKFGKKITVIRSYRDSHSCCVFMDKIYIIGGRDRAKQPTKFCIELNTVSRKYRHIKMLNEARVLAASTVYEEKVVVSGGDLNGNILSTVEAYDHVLNTWTCMSNMNYGRYNHSLVAIKNKLYVFGEEFRIFEMYDSNTKRFAILKPPNSFLNTEFIIVTGAISIGRKILIFKRFSTTITVFDLDKNKWSEENVKGTKEIEAFFCLKLPKI